MMGNVTPLPAPAARVRRLPVPPIDPPYDDELPAAAVVAGEGAMILPLPLPDLDPPLPPAAKRLHLVPPLGREEPVSLPPPRAWAARLAQAIVEVLAGERPLSQLVRWTSENVYADLGRWATAQPDRRARRTIGQGRLQALRTCEPERGIVEAAAVIRFSNRHRLVALRLEVIRGRWVCTRLALG
jgi:hypothetical protein